MAAIFERGTWEFSPKSVRRFGIATDLPSAAFNIFAVQNAPIAVQGIFGVVTTLIGAGLAVPRIQFTPTGGALTPLAAAAASIAASPVNTVFTIMLVGGVNTLGPGAAAGIQALDENIWGGASTILVPGIISITNAVPGTGIIDWYIIYRGLAPNSLVAAL